MISNHIKKGFWIWASACVALWVLGKQPYFQQYAFQMSRVATIGLWGGAALAAMAMFIASYFEQSRAAKRLRELYARVQAGETVEIRGGSGLPRLIVLMTLAGIVVMALGAARTDIDWIVQACVGAMAAILAFIELLTVGPLLRQPILRISKESLESPVFGKLSWRDIDSFSEREVGLSGFAFHKRFNLGIPRLPSLTSQLPTATRLKHRIRSIFRPSTTLSVRLLRPSEMPKVILALCKRASSEYTMESRREQMMAEMKASLESPPKPPSQAPTEFERKLSAQIDAVGIKEALRLQMEELRETRDKLWDWEVSPPREFMPTTHWTTWIAAVVCGALMIGFIYLLYSAPI